MANLKELRVRINSVKSTRKITAAMKMVAASKSRRAQMAAMAARPYSSRMERMLGALAQALAGQASAPALLAGTGADKTHLLVAVTSDRGLCGGFNGNVVRAVRTRIRELEAQGKTAKLLIIGRKGRDQLKREFAPLYVEVFDNIGRKGVVYGEAVHIAETIRARFTDGQFDVCTLVYNRFKSIISQELTFQQVIPFPLPQGEAEETGVKAMTEFEPSEEAILDELLPRNLAVQLFRALLESAASEQGARMAAMDNATRNAGDMINRLTIVYNRSRQSQITKELIEIISGAEAL
jgi:F-type H+-transporting ATPase subunit gamma